MDEERIVLEGASDVPADRFEREVEGWVRGRWHAEIHTIGDVVVVRVRSSDVEEMGAELDSGLGPDNLDRAFIPARSRWPDGVIHGRAYARGSQIYEDAPGCRRVLAALPPAPQGL